MKRRGLVRGALVAAALGGASVIAAGCGEDERPGYVSAQSGGGGQAGTGNLVGGSGGSGGSAVGNCGEDAELCKGHASCVLDEAGNGTCVCDEGYVRNKENTACVVDETCIRVKPLENRCRVRAGGVPAVSMFFAVDYCAGTAVLPAKLGDVNSAFKVLEGLEGRELAPPGDESYATVLPRPVESYVTIAIDYSSSVRNQPELLSNVVSELRDLVRGLKPGAGEPTVGVSLMVFGIYVGVLVPFTTDFDEVDRELAALENDPSKAIALAGVREGTALFEATHKGIRNTQRIQQLREAVTEGGVLSTGTLVVVTDGINTAGGELDTDLVSETLVNLVSIGISNSIDDADLERIGRDGSFLAPDAEDRMQAFDEIAQRVKEYPKRAYMLAYCSPAKMGEQVVEVSLATLPSETTARCEFDATIFGANAPSCNSPTFATDACTTMECGGGVFACGACAANKCCSGGQCADPTATLGDCREQDELCRAEGKVCVENPDVTGSYHCVAPQAAGADCSVVPCGADLYCEPESKTCAPITLGLGDVCGDKDTHSPELCPNQSCANVYPNENEPWRCTPEALAYEPCEGTFAASRCESGTSCDSVCVPRGVFGCTEDADCASGVCSPAKVCARTGQCSWTWNQKMNAADGAAN